MENSVVFGGGRSSREEQGDYDVDKSGSLRPLKSKDEYEVF